MSQPSEITKDINNNVTNTPKKEEDCPWYSGPLQSKSKYTYIILAVVVFVVLYYAYTKFYKNAEEFTEETIYRAFIVLCKFNSFAPLNPELHAICSDKPEYINNNDSIIDKINKLKQDGRHYTNQSFLRLVQIVSRQNIMSNNNTNFF